MKFINHNIIKCFQLKFNTSKIKTNDYIKKTKNRNQNKIINNVKKMTTEAVEENETAQIEPS